VLLVGFAFPIARDVGDHGDLLNSTRHFSTFIANKGTCAKSTLG
jgi:hypothetical protein